jgi:hypothetical protein
MPPLRFHAMNFHRWSTGAEVGLLESYPNNSRDRSQHGFTLSKPNPTSLHSLFEAELFLALALKRVEVLSRTAALPASAPEPSIAFGRTGAAPFFVV